MVKNSARVFIARSGTLAIVVTMHLNEDGIWYEDQTPVTLKKPLNPEDLGIEVGIAMKKTTRRAKDIRVAKPSDWPAFRASGAKSIRQFELSFIPIEVESANEANLIAIVTGSPVKDADLRVTSSVSTATPAQIGECILRVYEACRDRRV